jgi:hypothetical protein
MNYNTMTKPCDELARALVDVVPEDLAVLTIRRSSANNARVSISLDVDAARVAIARWLGVADEIGVWLTACGKATWFVRARGAHRLADADWASVLRGVDGGAQWQMRSPHGIVVGRVDGGEFGDANVAKWRLVLQDDAAIPRVPLAMPMVCRCHQSFFFVDKHAATRVLTAAFGAQVPTKVAVDGVQYSVTHNWRPAARWAAADDGAQQQAAAPAPPSPAPLVRQAPPTVTQPIRRAVVFHDAENCWIGPTTSGVALHRRMVAHVRACVGGGSGDMRVEWNLVLQAKGGAPSDAQYRPARRAVEDLRDHTQDAALRWWRRNVPALVRDGVDAKYVRVCVGAWAYVHAQHTQCDLRLLVDNKGCVRICGHANCCKAIVSVRVATPSKRWTKGACNGDQ